MAKRMAKKGRVMSKTERKKKEAAREAEESRAELAESMDPKMVGPKIAKKRRLAKIKEIAERNKKKPKGKLVPARPNPKKKEKPVKKKKEISRGGVQQVTRDGATDLGTPAGTRSSGSGRGKMVQSKVKKQTLATEFDALKPNAKNAERLKGDKSKYASVMRERLGTRSKKKGKAFKLAPIGTPPPGFAKGGFPDLTGDGKVTRKDVLKGRGVAMNKGGMKKQYGTKNFMYGGSVMGKKKK